MKVSTKRDEAERLAKATVGARSAKPGPLEESSEFVSLPECWLDRIQLGFPRANSW